MTIGKQIIAELDLNEDSQGAFGYIHLLLLAMDAAETAGHTMSTDSDNPTRNMIRSLTALVGRESWAVDQVAERLNALAEHYATARGKQVV